MDRCIWNLCNSNCIMCTNPFGFRDSKKAEFYSKENVLGIIKSDAIKSGPTESVNLTGGEPTIHPDFLEILTETRNMLPDAEICFVTNGRRLVYPDFTRKVLEFNNLQIRSVIHSHKAEVHDSITRTPGSFKQTIKGVRNLFRMRNNSHVINLRVVILKQNYRDLDEISKFIHNKFGKFFRPQDKLAFMFPEYEGRAEKNFEQVKVSYTQVNNHIEDVLKKWPKYFYEKFFVFHFPLCTIDSTLWKYVTRSIPTDNDEYTFLEKCNDCIYKKYCVSIHKDYIKNFGQDEFTPFREEVDNDLVIDEDDFFRPIKKS